MNRFLFITLVFCGFISADSEAGNCVGSKAQKDQECVCDKDITNPTIEYCSWHDRVPTALPITQPITVVPSIPPRRGTTSKLSENSLAKIQIDKSKNGKLIGKQVENFSDQDKTGNAKFEKLLEKRQ